MTRRAVTVVLDGLRRDLLGPELTPNLLAFAPNATQFAEFRSVFPSATRVVSASFATGCFPARHGLAGNSMALVQDGAIVRHDAGHPDFLQHRRRVTGRSLDVPTLAERLATQGGGVVFSNVSPGAAYAHDPDGHGTVRHRAGSFAPGRRPLDPLPIALDIAGDAAMTAQFLDDAVGGTAAHSMLWLGEPDHTQHETPLGSPDCRAAIAAADKRFGEVRAAVERRRAMGEDILLIAMSDHGHRTVSEIVDIDAAFTAAGLKRHAEDGDLVAVSNGTGALIYQASHRSDADRVVAFLRTQPWADEVVAGADLARIGQRANGGLIAAVSMRCDETPNKYGVPGSGPAALPHAGKPDRLGCGQHGGLGRYDQLPFLLIEGPGFVAGATSQASACIVDLAPSILYHLGQNWDGCDGRPLQPAQHA